jgi:hypothetical protein
MKVLTQRISWKQFQDGAAKQMLPPTTKLGVSDRREDRLKRVEQICLTWIFDISHSVAPSAMNEETLARAIKKRQATCQKIGFFRDTFVARVHSNRYDAC